MKKQFLLSALILSGFIAFTSCKKKKDDSVIIPAIQQCMINTAVNGNDSTKVTYDSQNRVVKSQVFDKTTNNSKWYSLYTYNANNLVEQQYDNNSVLIQTITYHLNANNTVAYSNSNDGKNELDTTWFTYNGNQQLTRRATKNTSIHVVNIITRDSTWYTYNGNNISQVAEKSNTGNIVTTLYSYGSMDAKSAFLAPEQGTLITNLYGKTSEKLAVSKTQGSTTTTYTYTLNTNGYVSRAQVLSGGNVVSDFHYSYNCQ
jgi:hypothetical protein